jgi:hypothetical protein
LPVGPCGPVGPSPAAAARVDVFFAGDAFFFEDGASFFVFFGIDFSAVTDEWKKVRKKITAPAG